MKKIGKNMEFGKISKNVINNNLKNTASTLIEALLLGVIVAGILAPSGVSQMPLYLTVSPIPNFVEFVEDVYYPNELLNIRYSYTGSPQDVYIIVRGPSWDGRDNKIYGFWDDLEIGTHLIDSPVILEDSPVMGTYTVQMVRGNIDDLFIHGNNPMVLESDFDQILRRTADLPTPIPVVLSEDSTAVELDLNQIKFDQSGYHYNETTHICYNWDGVTTPMHVALYDPDGRRTATWTDLEAGINELDPSFAIPDDPELRGLWSVYLINNDPVPKYGDSVGIPFDFIRSEDVAEIHECNNPRYAVIVAGAQNGDPVYDEFLRTTNLVWSALSSVGYEQDNIFYLNDGNAVDGYDYPVFAWEQDAENTKVNVEYAIKTWLRDKIYQPWNPPNTQNENVVIYFVGHGAEDGYFFLKYDGICRTEMKDWIDYSLLDDGYNWVTFGGANIVVDCCYSGQLMDYIKGMYRVAITSCGSDELAYFTENGVSDFSEPYASAIHDGSCCEEAYWIAFGQAWNQTPQMEDEFTPTVPYRDFWW